MDVHGKSQCLRAGIAAWLHVHQASVMIKPRGTNQSRSPIQPAIQRTQLEGLIWIWKLSTSMLRKLDFPCYRHEEWHLCATHAERGCCARSKIAWGVTENLAVAKQLISQLRAKYGFDIWFTCCQTVKCAMVSFAAA